MTRMTRIATRTALLGATGMALLAQCLPAQAADDATLGRIEKEIAALQAELKHVKRSLAARDQAVRDARAEAAQARSQVAAAPPTGYATGGLIPQIPQGYALVPARPGSAPGSVELAREEPGPSMSTTVEGKPLPPGTFRLGGVTVQIGGFIEAASIARSRNDVADVGSNFNAGIPLPNTQLYHEGEFRESARQSRLSLLATANINPATSVGAYYETDFLGSSPTGNSNESNSYTLRLRQAYAQLDNTTYGLHFEAGQAWSLATLDKHGIIPRQEDIPLTIDAQYVPGFNWARQAQFRATKSFDNDKYWLAASVEEPQAVFYTGPNGLAPSSVGTINVANPGVSLLPSTVNYSDDIAPDVIVKAAADPGYGHYEIYGLLRFLHDRVSQTGSGHSDTTLAGGGGIGMVLPLVPKILDFRLSALAGDGIGRYGSGQLPDAVVGPDGAPDPLPEVEGLVGLEAHPIKSVDVYAYGGTEQIGRRSFASAGRGYGYGSALYSNASCETELGAAASCVANTKGITQGTLGAWWRFYKGSYGTVQTGVQYSYTRRDIFGGVGATPSTDNNMVFFSLRYYPFQ